MTCHDKSEVMEKWRNQLICWLFQSRYILFDSTLELIGHTQALPPGATHTFVRHQVQGEPGRQSISQQ